MTDEQDSRRGAEAREVLDNPIYAEAYDSVRGEILALWEASRDAADREQLHTMLGLLTKTRTAIESVMRTGEVATAEIKRKKSLAERTIGRFRAA